MDAYKENLVVPTIQKFNSKNDSLTMDEIKVNHNNVSHTERLGLIEKNGKENEVELIRKQIIELLALLGVSENNIINQGYVQLILNKK